MRNGKSRAPRLSLALLALLLAASGPVDTIPAGHGYGAANAGGTGKLPPGPAAKPGSPHRTGPRGQGGVAGGGGPATGSKAGASAGNVETGGTEGAGSR